MSKITETPVATTATEPTVAPSETPTIAATPVATTQVTGNWNEQKGKLKAQFTTLTDADLHYENGKKEEMFSRIQVKIGKTKGELDTIISTL